MFEFTNILAKQPGNPYGGLIMMGIMVVMFWVLLIRPQSKRRKEQQNMVNAMQKGDTVVTIGGIHGEVNAINDSKATVSLKLSEGLFVTFDKSSVASVKNKDSEGKKSDSEKLHHVLQMK